MKDKIEVGEYVRTKEGEIHKVIKIIEDDGDWDYYCYENNAGYFAMDIANHTKQLIDLIENADILKIKISEEWVEKQDTIKFVVVGQTYTITEIKSCLEDGLFEIIQILTHEQVEANCYKVGGEDE